MKSTGRTYREDGIQLLKELPFIGSELETKEASTARAVVGGHGHQLVERTFEVDGAPGCHCDAVPSRWNWAHYAERLDAVFRAKHVEVFSDNGAVEDARGQAMDLAKHSDQFDEE